MARPRGFPARRLFVWLAGAGPLLVASCALPPSATSDAGAGGPPPGTGGGGDASAGEGGAAVDATSDGGPSRQTLPAVAGCGDMSGLQPGAAWPMLGYCPTHQGRSPLAGPRSSHVKWTWTSPENQLLLGSPAVDASGVIYLPGEAKLYAITPGGCTKWESAAVAGAQSTPALGKDGTIYASPGDGTLAALDPATGNARWSVQLDSSFEVTPSSPALGPDGTVYVAHDVTLYAVDPASGHTKWSYAVSQSVGSSSPALDGQGNVYIGAQDGFLYAVDPTGALKWKFAAFDPQSSSSVEVESPSLEADGTIVVAATSGLYAVDPTGKQLWHVTDTFQSDLALAADGTLYAGDGSGALLAISLQGTQRWSFPTPGHFLQFGPTVGLDGVVYAGMETADSHVFAVDATGKQIWSSSLPFHAPTQIALGLDGTAYVHSDDAAGTLVAYGDGQGDACP